MAGWLLKLKKWYTRKRITTVVHLLLSPTQGLCSKPRHQSRGQHVLLWWCGSSGPSPARGTTRKRLQHSPFSVGPGSWNHKIPDHEMAAALLLLRRLFLSIGGKWGVGWMPMTPSLYSDAWRQRELLKWRWAYRPIYIIALNALTFSLAHVLIAYAWRCHHHCQR